MTHTTLEREIKLHVEHASTAREAILRIGATPLRGRRLQEDCLLDAPDERLRQRRSVLRIRMEQGRALCTFKGPVQPSRMKLREEREVVVADGETLLYIFQQMGFEVWFRYEKYREEFGAADAVIALDETPIGTFIEIEGGEQAIVDIAAALGYSADDYVLDSYRGLWAQHCEREKVDKRDMTFDEA
jgi:adenylate cyclase, class 2